jgi:hypothetical protein
MFAGSMHRSERASVVIAVLGGLLLFGAGLVVATARGVLDRDQFATRVARSLRDERVAGYVAGLVVNGLLEVRPNLIGVRPILDASIREVIQTAPFRALVRSSARTAHYSLFDSPGQRVVLALPDLSVLLRSALSQGNPALAEKIPASLEAALASDEAQRTFTAFIDFWRMASKLLLLCWVLTWVGLALLLSSIALAPDRRRGLVFVGSVLAAAGIGFLAMVPLGRILPFAVTDDPALRGAMSGLWLAYFAGLRWAALMFAGTGLVFAAAGTTVLEAADPLRHGRRVWDRVTGPTATSGLRVARGAVMLAVGAAAIAAPLLAVASLGALAGIVLVYLGLREVFRVLLPHGPDDAVALAPGQAGGQRVVLGVAVTAVVLLLGGAAFFALRRDERSVVALGAVSACNGSARLCDVPVDRVVFPGAHNAMSNAEIARWLFPHHRHRVRRMLDDGIRMLALDVHYGVPTAGRVRTDLEREQLSREKIEEQLGPEATAAAVRIRDELVGQAEGASGLFFCHGFCELGSYEVGPTLREIRDFLVLNPGEVVMLVMEDYVQPADLAAAFTAAGLAEFAYTGPVQRPWPTLRRLVDDNQRLIVFAESGRPGVPWLRPAFETFQETPYSFHKPEDFSCRPNRGGTSGSLFQINHWIETTPAPQPTNAEIVNAYDFLLQRARECRRVRKHVPNVIAVDFYDVGDVVRVARTLNGQDSTGAVARAR